MKDGSLFTWNMAPPQRVLARRTLGGRLQQLLAATT
jgi:hypothetical protein